MIRALRRLLCHHPDTGVTRTDEGTHVVCLRCGKSGEGWLLW